VGLNRCRRVAREVASKTYVALAPVANLAATYDANTPCGRFEHRTMLPKRHGACGKMLPKGDATYDLSFAGHALKMALKRRGDWKLRVGLKRRGRALARALRKEGSPARRRIDVGPKS
jgi:hypothetical protein